MASGKRSVLSAAMAQRSSSERFLYCAANVADERTSNDIAPLSRFSGLYFHCARLLVDPGFGDADGELANAGDDADTLRHTDGASRVEQVEKMRAFQAELVS